MEKTVRANIGMLPMGSDIAEPQLLLCFCQRGPFRPAKVSMGPFEFNGRTPRFRSQNRQVIVPAGSHSRAQRRRCPGSGLASPLRFQC